MAKEAGKNWKYYLNTGTVASPTWTEVPNQKDSPFAVTQNMIDTTTKSDAGWVSNTPSTRTWEGSMSIVYDKAQSTHATIVSNAMNQTSTQFKLVGASGENWIVTCYVSIGFGTPVSDMCTLDVTLEPDGAPTYAAS